MSAADPPAIEPEARRPNVYGAWRYPAMAQKKAAKKGTRKPASGFTAEERAAMKERAQELKAARRGADAEKDVLAKLAGMPEQDRVIGERLHAIVKANAPDLAPRLWYGMPAYAGKDGKVVCYFQNAAKFKTRYSTFGFSDKAKLDDGALFPVVFAVKKLTAADEKRIGALVKQAVS